MGNEALTGQINAYINAQVPITPEMSAEQVATAKQTRKELAESAAQMVGAATVALAGGAVGQGSAQNVQLVDRSRSTRIGSTGSCIRTRSNAFASSALTASSKANSWPRCV